MITANYDIRFDFRLETARLNIILEASVEEHHSDPYYIVSNFHIPGQGDRVILPPITIRKAKGEWVHTDSGKATALSAAAGRAIEARGGMPLVFGNLLV